MLDEGEWLAGGHGRLNSQKELPVLTKRRLGGRQRRWSIRNSERNEINREETKTLQGCVGSVIC